jgi:L-glyceraldehyde 3-phosphate reductase
MTAQAVEICRAKGFFAPIIHQPSYSILGRGIEQGVQEACARGGLGIIAFCPLAQGLLTSKYIKDIPQDSRAKQAGSFLNESRVTQDVRDKARRLNEIAEKRGQSLAQLALAWVLRDRPAGQTVTSALIGASKPSQIEENVRCLDRGPITADELKAIDAILAG